jgi:heme iron utilization protein
VPWAEKYIDFGDFTLWVLRVDHVRWYGGYGRMDVVTGEAYAAAQPDRA